VPICRAFTSGDAHHGVRIPAKSPIPRTRLKFGLPRAPNRKSPADGVLMEPTGLNANRCARLSGGQMSLETSDESRSIGRHLNLSAGNGLDVIVALHAFLRRSMNLSLVRFGSHGY
jgi:hypothetical protein